jgi:hypothetical protein
MLYFNEVMMFSALNLINTLNWIFALTSECCVVIRETANTDCIAFAQIRPGLETTIYSLSASTQAITSNNTVCPLATDHTRKFFPPIISISQGLIVLKQFLSYFASKKQRCTEDGRNLKIVLVKMKMKN